MKKSKTTATKQTPFELALEQARSGKLQTPSVSNIDGSVDYFFYQLATNEMALKLLTKGIIMTRNAPKLKHYKDYYGLKGKTASDCLAQFIEIKNNYVESIKRLYFVRDLTFARENQVYSGHSGTGKKFQMYMGDYGKYAMVPGLKSDCLALIERIEKDAKGTQVFKWDIVPMTEISLCNFYEDTKWNSNAYKQLKESQLKLFPKK